MYAVNPDDLPAWPRSEHLDSFVHEALPRIQEWIAEDIARSQLEAALSALPHADVTGSVLSGVPPIVIRRRAVDCGATLLVTGTAARKGLEHLLLGSVSGAVAA